MTAPDNLSAVLASSPHRPLDQGGRVEVYHGQRYQRLRVEPYTRRDGTKTTVIIWRSSCMSCGAEFECVTSSDPAFFKPVRNCPDHRRRLAWRDRVAETDPVVAARPLPDGRPIAPVSAYEDHRK